jgi:hypothetical protein
MFELAVENFPEGFTRNPRTWARDHSFFYTIETISGPTYGEIYSLGGITPSDLSRA